METAKKIYKFIQSEKHLFSGAHDIYTPQPLVEEILSKINCANQTILVMFNVEFAISLVYTFKVDPSLITLYADHKNKVNLAERLGIKYTTTLLGIPMKFDVILANPPYTAENTKIYQHFYNQAVSLLSPNGTIGFIAPFAISRGFVGRKVGDVTLDCQDLVLFNNDNIKEKYFPKVGIDNICYFIVTQGYDKDATIITDGSTKTVDLKTLSTFPVVLNDIVLSIVQKCFDSNRNYTRRSNFHNKQSKESSTGATFVITKINDSGNAEGYKIPHETNGMSGKPRIFLNTLGKRAIVDYSHQMMMKPNGSMICVETASDLESENLVYLLNHNHELIDFMSNYIIGNARSPYDTFLLNFKKVDLSTKWTSDMLYKKFNLTKDEIAYIRSSSK